MPDDDILRTRISNNIYSFMPTEYPTPDDADEAADALIRQFHIVERTLPLDVEGVRFPNTRTR